MQDAAEDEDSIKGIIKQGRYKYKGRAEKLEELETTVRQSLPYL